MTVIEAMACGTPVVVTSLGGIRHFLNHDKDAMTVNPKNTEEMSLAIDKILKNNSLRKNLIENGLKTVYEKFTWDAIAAQHIDFFNRLS